MIPDEEEGTTRGIAHLEKNGIFKIKLIFCNRCVLQSQLAITCVVCLHNYAQTDSTSVGEKRTVFFLLSITCQ